MSATGVMTLASGPAGCHIFTGCGFPAPSYQNSFIFQPIFTIGSFQFTKPMLLVLLTIVLILGFFGYAFRNPQVVPRGAQNVGEWVILQVRDQMVRPQLGSKGDKYLPYLAAFFLIIWPLNLFELIPWLQFPAASRYSYPLSWALIVWVTYIGLGIKTQGPLHYLKSLTIPTGAPWWILWLLVPIEFLSNVIVRPFTLSIRLFANMLAGHLLLLVFSLGSWYLFSYGIGLLFSATSFIVFILVFALEVLITLLQAFIFTTLAAFYISDALEPAH
jgi:F-type H+-transporting ATPase subunit a